METKVSKQRKLLLTLVLLLICIGCTHVVPPINANLSCSPAVDPLPLSVGVYYSQEFLENKQVLALGYLKSIYSLGPPSAQLFDQIFDAIFEKTLRVDSLHPSSADATKLDAIIEPRIEGLWRAMDEQLSVVIAYSITVFSLSGEKLASFRESGRGRMIHESLRHVAAQLVANFCEYTEVRKWLQHAGISSPQED